MKESMDNFRQRVIRIVRNTLIILGVFVLGTITPYSDIFVGLVLGTFVGLINLLFTAYKVNKIGELAIQQQVHNKTKPVFTGMFSRIATTLLAIMLALKFPQYINLISTLIGLFITQIISVVDGIKNH